MSDSCITRCRTEFDFISNKFEIFLEQKQLLILDTGKYLKQDSSSPKNACIVRFKAANYIQTFDPVLRTVCGLPY